MVRTLRNTMADYHDLVDSGRRSEPSAAFAGVGVGADAASSSSTSGGASSRAMDIERPLLRLNEVVGEFRGSL
jgi:hypothetical protein